MLLFCLFLFKERQVYCCTYTVLTVVLSLCFCILDFSFLVLDTSGHVSMGTFYLAPTPPCGARLKQSIYRSHQAEEKSDLLGCAKQKSNLRVELSVQPWIGEEETQNLIIETEMPLHTRRHLLSLRKKVFRKIKHLFTQQTLCCKNRK